MDKLSIQPTPWPPSDRRALNALVGLLLVALVALFGLKARNEAREHQFIGVPIERNVITVTGEGKVIAVPDVAAIDLGTTVERQTVAAAQEENTRVMNAVIKTLGEMGVDKKDIRTTSYSIRPVYDWTDGRQRLRAYQAAQSVQVKIRDLEKVGDIVGAAGQMGVNQAGNVAFAIDDPEALKQEARLLALANAKEKAEALSKAVGVKLRRVVSFSESFGQAPPPYFYDKVALGRGAEAAEPPAPSIEPGSSEIVVNADVTYEIE